jgi:hypothetical protein
VRFAIAWVVGALAVNACSDTRGDEVHGVGGTAGSGTGGRGTSGSGGSSKGGSTSGGATSGGATSGGVAGTAGTLTGGSGGSGACVENLACELDALPATGDLHQDCVDRINQFRRECACLPPLARWTAGEACANEMAEYDSTRRAHAGFIAGVCEGGSAQNECPGWDSEDEVIEGCLQSMWDEGPPPDPDDCDDACFDMYGHFINMSSTDYSRVACGFFTTPGGEIWAVQNFSD